jgi:hypothetical protein
VHLISTWAVSPRPSPAAILHQHNFWRRSVLYITVLVTSYLPFYPASVCFYISSWTASYQFLLLLFILFYPASFFILSALLFFTFLTILQLQFTPFSFSYSAIYFIFLLLSLTLLFHVFLLPQDSGVLLQTRQWHANNWPSGCILNEYYILPN